MSEEFDPAAMIERFRATPPRCVPGACHPSKARSESGSAEQAQVDFMDYAMLGDAEASLEDGILTLRVDLRPRR